MNDSKIYDVIIIGSGPAGYAAAIYTSRAFLKTLILTGETIGGQLTTTTEVENFPGFEKGIYGTELVENMKKQAERFNTEIIIDSVKSIKVQNSNIKSNPNAKDPKDLIIETLNNTYFARSVIIATGAQAKYLGLPSEEKLKGKGVSGCATCDGFFFQGKEVVVIGGGDTAMEEATFLTRFASKVTIVHRREEFRASPVMLKRAQDNPKISFLLNKETLEIIGQEKVTGIRLKDNKTGKTEDYKTDGVFLAIGHKPATEFVKGLVEMDEKGYILIQNQKSNIKNQNENSNVKSEEYIKEISNPMMLPQTATNVPGIFAAGDCVDPHYRQAIVAAGMGAMAALDAQHYLEE